MDERSGMDAEPLRPPAEQRAEQPAEQPAVEQPVADAAPAAGIMLVPGAAPESSTHSSEPARPHPRREPPRENVKETIESILIAFILAFVFRAFVVEAFVIPSGSMAPTLLGGHMRFRCEECGSDWTLNYPGDVGSDDDSLNIPTRTSDDFQSPAVVSTRCPNCGFQPKPGEVGQENSAANTPVHYGDRILVLKYLYLLQGPSRWDVVVFKAPSGDYSVNYIKRLVGRPGETLMLLDGDVYTRPNDSPDAPESWKVQAKPRKAQEALWRVVHDNDYLATNAHPERQKRPWVTPWRQRTGAGWSVAEKGPSRVVRFDNAEGNGTLFFDRGANRGVYPLTDWLPYNETKWVTLPGSRQGPSWSKLSLDYDPYGQEDRGMEWWIPRWYVNDLKVKFSYERKAGDGPLRAMLTKRGDTFVAEFVPGVVRLLHLQSSGQERQVGKDVVLEPGPVNVEFQNVDYQVTLRVNGRDVLRTTAEDYRPDVAKLRELHDQRQRLADGGADREQIRRVFGVPRVELFAGRQTCEVSHLSLWRDVYYTPGFNNYRSGLNQGSPEIPVMLHAKGEGSASQENEYFVLGDNSIMSSDGRAWNHDVWLEENENLYTRQGKVPERFLLGQAFFVYWPAGYRPVSPEAPGIIPNFGAMRFIH